MDALNSLQSNSAQLAEQRASGGRDLAAGLAATRTALTRVGLGADDIARLHAVHIAGSKVRCHRRLARSFLPFSSDRHSWHTQGKGSTAAMTEALLRARGLKTGLYTCAVHPC